MSKAAEPDPQDTGDDEECEESTWQKLRTPGADFDEVRAVLSCCCCAQWPHTTALQL